MDRTFSVRLDTVFSQRAAVPHFNTLTFAEKKTKIPSNGHVRPVSAT